MAKTKRLMAALLTLVMIVCIIPFSVMADGSDGWYKSGDYWYYRKDGQDLTSQWLKDGGKWYYLSGDGRMLQDTIYCENSKVYAFGSSGAMVTKAGWFKMDLDEYYSYYYGISEAWFYVKKGGVCVTGWKKISGKWYYFSPTNSYFIPAIMVAYNSINDNGTVYAFKKNGQLQNKTGWVSYKFPHATYWVYLKKGGVCTTGWKKIGGIWYYFNKSYGDMYCNGTYKIDDIYYQFDENGKCLNPDGSSPAT